MTNWKDIHPDFTPELQKEWEGWGFNPQTTKEWIDTGFIKPTDVGYVQWLKKWAWKKSDDIQNQDNEKFLRNHYETHLIQKPNSVYCPSEYVKRNAWRKCGLSFSRRNK